MPRASGAVHSVREIEALIPHRWPFLLVDRIVEYDPDAKRIVGIKAVTATEWFFQGHFPGLPVMPGVLQVEALAQTMAVYVAKQPGFGDRIGLFAGIDEVRFKRDRRAGRHPPPRDHDGEAGLPVRQGPGRRHASTARSPARACCRSSSRRPGSCDDGASRVVTCARSLTHAHVRSLRARLRLALRRPRRPPMPDDRIAVLSDVHGNLLALEAVLKEIKKREARLAAGRRRPRAQRPGPERRSSMRCAASRPTGPRSCRATPTSRSATSTTARPSRSTRTASRRRSPPPPSGPTTSWATTSSTGCAGCRPSAGSAPATTCWSSWSTPRPARRPAASTRRSTRTSSSSAPPPPTPG